MAAAALGDPDCEPRGLGPASAPPAPAEPALSALLKTLSIRPAFGVFEPAGEISPWPCPRSRSKSLAVVVIRSLDPPLGATSCPDDPTRSATCPCPAVSCALPDPNRSSWRSPTAMYCCTGICCSTCRLIATADLPRPGDTAPDGPAPQSNSRLGLEARPGDGSGGGGADAPAAPNRLGPSWDMLAPREEDAARAGPPRPSLSSSSLSSASPISSSKVGAGSAPSRAGSARLNARGEDGPQPPLTALAGCGGWPWPWPDPGRTVATAVAAGGGSDPATGRASAAGDGAAADAVFLQLRSRPPKKPAFLLPLPPAAAVAAAAAALPLPPSSCRSAPAAARPSSSPDLSCPQSKESL